MGLKYRGSNSFMKFIIISLFLILIYFFTTYSSPWNLSQVNPFQCNVIVKTQPVLRDWGCRLINFSFCQDLLSSISHYVKMLLRLCNLWLYFVHLQLPKPWTFSHVRIYFDVSCYVTAHTGSPICHLLSLQFETIFGCFSLCQRIDKCWNTSDWHECAPNFA